MSKPDPVYHANGECEALMSDLYNRMARNCADIALEAAVPVLDFYRKGFSSRAKADGSPVTDADIASDQIIRERLHANWPDIPVVSEEHVSATQIPLERFFLVDPLDGTREFVNRTDEFTINIALIVNGKSVAGVIYAPARGDLFLAGENAFAHSKIEAGARINPQHLHSIATRHAARDAYIALASLSHGDPATDAFLTTLHPRETRKSGSSLKFCLIAKGEADLYPRFSPTMGWDIAAGHAILHAAGGVILDETGSEFRYTNTKLSNGPFLAAGDPALTEELKAEFIRIARTTHRA